MTVQELENRISSQELSEWVAYDALELIPDHHWIGAMIACTIKAVMGSGKGRRPEIEDFIPRAKPVKIMSGEEGRAMFQAMAIQGKARQERLAK